jgi:CarboxypepD_reg-like domain/Secretion system C-terminal sorting domain
MKKGLFTLTLLCSIIVALSAQKTVTGTVLDDKKEPIVGAAIVIKGTNMGTLTDENGQYSIKMTDLDTLVLSFVGYKSKEFVSKTNEMDLAMEEGILLEEFVKIAGSRYYCAYPGYSKIFQLTINSELFLDAYSYKNGATKLNFKIESLWTKSIELNENWQQYENDLIKYTISKSYDNENFRAIGNTVSTKPKFIEKDAFNSLEIWGKGDFLDREINKSDSTYYLIEGIFEYFVENTEGVKTKESKPIYSKKISIANSNYLKINTLFNLSNQLELSISSPLNEVANFRIVDMAGRVLTSHQQTLLKENNTLTLAHNDLPAGMYILHVQQGEQTDSRKFTITK